MTDNPQHSRPSLRSALVAFALFLGVFYWLVVASYPEFFFFNPLDDPSLIRRITLTISLVGWFAISTLPAVVLVLYALGSSKWLGILPGVALLWPSSVVLNQLVLLGRDGQLYLDYLLNHPIFIATDIALPALLLALYFDLRIEKGKHAQAEA